ncbi:MAG: helix-turn-helix domain-containing protein [Endomicrobium sp.]|nr:helix-turn-helix domain-containing protein [Endomicrobium sp.]
MIDVGKKIKQAMIDSNLTQTELANRLGVKQQAVSRWVIGRTDITISTLQKVAEVTKKPLQYFFENFETHSDNSSMSKQLEDFISKNSTEHCEILENLQSIKELFKNK